MASDEPAATPAPRPMLLDDLMPEFDATRREHRVIDGEQDPVYRAVLDADFMAAWRHNSAVRLLFAARSAAEKAVARVRARGYAEPPAPDALRLADMTSHGKWVRLGEDPPNELVFGAIGRFWAGETAWEQIESDRYRELSPPGSAKIACSFSLRPYGRDRMLVSYEARTLATDEAARRAFLRYWNAVSIGVGVVMRSQLAVVERQAATAS